MKRSGSKLIGKAGSIRNINKLGYKFNVKLHIESVDKILSASEVFISWERNDKVKLSGLVKVDRDKRSADFQGETLVQDITFFKRKKDGSTFEDKVYRLVLKQQGDKKSIGRIDLNFAQYIDMPSCSKRLAASLSNGSDIIMRIESKFLKEAKQKSSRKKGGDDDTSSVGSSQFESEFDLQDFGKEDDAIFDDLAVDESFDGGSAPISNVSNDSQPTSFNINTSSANHHPQVSSNPSFSNQQSTLSTTANNNPSLSSLASGSVANVSSSGQQTRRPPLAPTNSTQFDDHNSAIVPVTPSIVPSNASPFSNNQNSNRRGTNTSAPPAQGPLARARKSRDTSPVNDHSIATVVPAKVSGSRFKKSNSRHDNLQNQAQQQSSERTYSRQEYEALQRENKQLRRRNDDYQTRISELEHRLENYASFSSGNPAARADSLSRAEIDDLTQENKSLKEHIDDLEMRIRREPIYADVVRDLREAKMALAIMNIERDEHKQEIRKLKKR